MRKYVCPKCKSYCDTTYCNDCNCSIPSDMAIEVESADEIAANSKRCPHCGEKISKNDINCKSCGELITYAKANSQSNYSSQRYQSSSSVPFFVYVLSFLIPIVGFVAGGVMLADDDKRDSGKTCIITGLAAAVIYIITILLITR